MHHFENGLGLGFHCSSQDQLGNECECLGMGRTEINSNITLKPPWAAAIKVAVVFLFGLIVSTTHYRYFEVL